MMIWIWTTKETKHTGRKNVNEHGNALGYHGDTMDDGDLTLLFKAKDIDSDRHWKGANGDDFLGIYHDAPIKTQQTVVVSGWWLTYLPLVGNILLILMVNVDGYYMVNDNNILVGGFSPPLWKMMEFVSWDDDIPI